MRVGKTFAVSSAVAAILLAAALSALGTTPERAQSGSPSPNGAAAQGAASPAAAPAASVAPASESGSVTAAWKVLTTGAASDKYITRSDAISTLVVLGTNRRAVNLVVHALSDHDSIIRVLAASSLGEVKARAAIPALRVALDDKSPEVSFAAAQALWKMGDRSGREDFYEILSGERKTQPGIIQSNINKAKAEMHDPKALILIGINSASAATLGPGVLGVSAVEELATNKTAPVQALCIKLLSDDDTPDTVEQLKLALSDDHWIIRAAAARALAGMNHPDVEAQLEDIMANDKKEAVRFAAAAAIIRLNSQNSQPASRKAAPVTATPPAPQGTPAAAPSASR